jgi:DUF971 family protein
MALFSKRERSEKCSNVNAGIMQASHRKQHRPADLTVNRQAGTLEIEWMDGHLSTYRLSWLRRVCPCASCLDERQQTESDPLRLMSGPPPSADVEGAELVGNYAIRFMWADGHGSGIYGFSSLRASCPCQDCSKGEPAVLLSSV